jgi:thiamine biosynthesis lipoprotein
MGTILTVTVVADDEVHARRLAEEAIAEARRWDDVLTIWRPEGELARFNTKAGEGTVAISTSLAEGLSAMLRLAEETGGAFDPAAGARARNAALAPAPPPPRESADSDERVVLARSPPAPTGLAGVLRVNGVSASLRAGVSLDPGAIGKGIALDAAARLLRRGGAVAAFLDFGGSSQLAIGAPPQSPRGWKVAVSSLAEGGSHGILHLRDRSLSTSRAGALDTAPIVDPRSGAVVASPRLVTVLAPDATSADAWSTALVVLGADGAQSATANGLEFLVEDGAGRRLSTGFPLGR